MTDLVIAGDSRQERINNYIGVIGKQIEILDKLLENFNKLITTPEKVKVTFSPHLVIHEIPFVSGNVMRQIYVSDDKVSYDSVLD